MPNGKLERTTRLEQLNSAVRAIVTLSFTAGVLYGFIISKAISAEVFVPLASGIVTWWFVRDAQQATAKEAAALLNMPPPSPTTTTMTEGPSTTITGPAVVTPPESKP